MKARGWLVAVLLLATVASGDMGQPVFLNFKNFGDANHPYPYFTDSRDPMPIGLSLPLIQQEVNTAWQTWNSVSCSAFRAANQGGSSSIANAEDPYDQFSVSGVWITSIQDPMYNYLFGGIDTIAISIPTSYAGVLSTCDSYFNAVDYGWSVGPTTPAGAVDVQSAILHESGHCMGFGHFGILDPTVVMNPGVPVGSQRRVLTPVDVQAACQWYPTQDAVGAPCTMTGGCGASASLKCVTQTINAVNSSFCTNGCNTGTGSVCDLPLACAGSTLFSPTFNGACLRPDNSVTLVGAPCNNSPDCFSSLGICQQPNVTLGNNPQWVGGYCYQTCMPGQPPCPANSACTDIGGGDLRCLESCRVGFADCRQDYSCALTVNGGVCIPSCFADKDCGDTTQFVCRVCDGLCIAKQNATAKIGDPCTTDDMCGPGQVCANLDTTHSQKQCTQGCSRGCAVCPTGTSCHPKLTGELVCERDCSGLGSCAPGTQCLPTSSGSVCMPQCTSLNDCPVGLQCMQGNCVSGGTGGGAGGGGGNCGAFCQMDDAGMMGRGGGGHTGGSGGRGAINSGGCGCGATDANVVFAALVLTVVAMRRRRREAP